MNRLSVRRGACFVA